MMKLVIVKAAAICRGLHSGILTEPKLESRSLETSRATKIFETKRGARRKALKKALEKKSWKSKVEDRCSQIFLGKR